MQSILHKAQQKLAYWVGSSVVHLGDHNVPNAFMFIDKYTQIYRILLPLCTTLGKLGNVGDYEGIFFNFFFDILFYQGLKEYMDGLGGVEVARRKILRDFFRYLYSYIY